MNNLKKKVCKDTKKEQIIKKCATDMYVSARIFSANA